MTADPIGGVWTYALELARALESHGIQIALASMGARVTREQYQQVLARKNVRLFESTYRLEWMDDPWDDVDRAGDWLLQIAERTRADLIHLNDYSHAALPWAAPVLVAAHVSAKHEGAALHLSNLGTKFHDVLQLTRLLTVFSVYDSEAEAIRSFGPAAATA